VSAGPTLLFGIEEATVWPRIGAFALDMSALDTAESAELKQELLKAIPIEF